MDQFLADCRLVLGWILAVTAGLPISLVLIHMVVTVASNAHFRARKKVLDEMIKQRITKENLNG